MGDVVYETIAILKPNLKEDDYSNFKDYLSNLMGTTAAIPRVVQIEDVGVKKLAYRLQDKYDDGRYIVFTYAENPGNFSGTPSPIDQIEKQLRINDHVLKFMTIKTDKAPDILKEVLLEEVNNSAKETPGFDLKFEMEKLIGMKL